MLRGKQKTNNLQHGRPAVGGPVPPTAKVKHGQTMSNFFTRSNMTKLDLRSFLISQIYMGPTLPRSSPKTPRLTASDRPHRWSAAQRELFQRGFSAAGIRQGLQPERRLEKRRRWEGLGGYTNSKASARSCNDKNIIKLDKTILITIYCCVIK